MYHDIGFIDTHLEHEEIGRAITISQLKNYGYSKAKIEAVCGMIRATKIPQNPKNHLEQIIADADL